MVVLASCFCVLDAMCRGDGCKGGKFFSKGGIIRIFEVNLEDVAQSLRKILK